VRIELSPQAAFDLDRLQVWLLERGAVKSAREAFAQLQDGIDSLATFPNRGRSTPYPHVRELVKRFGRSAYLIQYRIYPDRVVVARIRHSREHR
jgi:plasmid stabilization system protein ParE